MSKPNTGEKKRRIIINIAYGRESVTAGRKHYAHVSTTDKGTVIHAFKRTDTTDTFAIWHDK